MIGMKILLMDSNPNCNNIKNLKMTNGTFGLRTYLCFYMGVGHLQNQYEKYICILSLIICYVFSCTNYVVGFNF